MNSADLTEKFAPPALSVPPSDHCLDGTDSEGEESTRERRRWSWSRRARQTEGGEPQLRLNMTSFWIAKLYLFTNALK